MSIDDDLLPQVPDLDFLEDFLLSDRVPEDAMSLSELDGFLAGIAIGPEVVELHEWLPIIWGGENAPAFAGEAEAKTVLEQIAALHNDILHQVRDGSYIPILWQEADGSPLPDGWTHAFLEGVGLRIDAWKSLLESEEHGYALIPIFAFCNDENGKPTLSDMSRKERERMRRDAHALIADAVLEIARYWGRVPVADAPPKQEPVRVAATPGRNDPCSCGSGKKYKKCCGAAA
jgi:uncharacterized protein